MRTSTSDRLTRATTEQLLDGGPGPAGLHQLLAAAAGPGTASELAGETAAVAAFADAHRASSPLPSAPSRRPSMLSTAISKILAAKALAAVVLLAGTTGGVALATTVSGTPSPADETAAASTATAAPAPSEPEPDAEASAGSEPDATASPQPSLAGLCKAWSAGATDNPGSAANNPAFGALVEAAGSPEDVPGYCAARAADDEHGRSGTAPGRAAEDQDAPPADKPGADPGRGVPPTAAQGNPDRPAGPPADRGGQDDDKQDDEEEDKGNSAKSDDKGNDDESPAAGRRQNG
jgi:hypothetical protein